MIHTHDSHSVIGLFVLLAVIAWLSYLNTGGGRHDDRQ